MKEYVFKTEAFTVIKAENEEEAWEKFWEEIESQPQQNACNWIEDHTILKEHIKLENDAIGAEPIQETEMHFLDEENKKEK